MSITRREFLLRSAVAAGLAALPRRRVRAATASADVIVVGAGLAGLQAALHLEWAGASTIVLEARERVGGKILTLAGVPGEPEAGGQSIGSGYGRVLAATALAGVTLEDQFPQAQRSPDVALVLDGRPIPRAEWPKSPRNPFPEELRDVLPWQYAPMAMAKGNPLRTVEGWFAPARAADDVSMHEFLAAQGATEAMIALAYDTNPSYGTSARDVSALQLGFVEAFQRGQRSVKPAVYRAQGGNRLIPEGMARRLEGGVRSGQQVTAIVSDAAGVTVHTQGGQRYTAGAAICALPCAALRRLGFDPPLAGAQAQAVQTLPTQPVTQIALVPAKPFWADDGLPPAMWTDTLAGRVFAIPRSPSDDEVVSLLVTAYGEKSLALDRLGPEGAARRVIAEIERVRPAAQGLLRVAAQHSWTADPWAGGAWAYFAPGTVTKFMPAMLQPHGRVHFCGEQTAIYSRGMEGAMESGERAAREVRATLAGAA